MPTSHPSQAQTAALAGLTGLFGGMSGELKRQQADKDAYLKSINDPDAALKRERLDLDREKFEQSRKLLGGGGEGTVPFGLLFGLEQENPLYNLPVGAKQAPYIAASGIKGKAPSIEESKRQTEAEQMLTIGKSFGEQWKGFGLGKGTAGQAVKGFAANILPGQVSQRTMDPKYKVLDDTKQILSETALRIATGAATNPSEVVAYKKFLPEPGDAPAVAANKINNFFNRVNQRAGAVASRLEVQGRAKDAAAYRKSVQEQLDAVKFQILQDVGGGVQVPGVGAAPGTAPKSKAASRLDNLGL